MSDIRKVLSYNDVLLCPRNSELEHLTDADILYSYDKCQNKYQTIPVINSPMDTVCSIELIQCLSNKYDMPTTIHRWFDSVEDQISFIKDCNLEDKFEKSFIAVGNIAKWKEWIDKIIQYREDNSLYYGLLVDVANGDTKACLETVKYIKALSIPLLNIMAGNVATRSGFSRLQEIGTDFIRCGIGAGSICSTRTSTGFGVPSLTTVMDCAKVKDNSYLVADGGVEHNGDICKAIAAGADMVMCGKLFAATSLSAGQKYDSSKYVTTEPENFKFCHYKGMASKESVKQLNSKKTSVSIEGVSGLIKYKGTTEEVVDELMGNLRSAVAYYGGCHGWLEFQKKIKFLEITYQGWKESETRLD